MHQAGPNKPCNFFFRIQDFMVYLEIIVFVWFG